METTPRPHHFKLTKLAALILCDMAEAPGWGTTNADLLGAFGVIGILTPNADSCPPDARKSPTQRQAIKTSGWCVETLEFDFSDRERDAARKAFTTLRNAGKLASGPATVELLTVLAIE